MKKILVTGGSGLVGSQIKSDFKINSKDANLISFEETRKIFEKYHPDYVIHTAAMVGGVGHNMSNNGDFFYKNIMINSNVLEACRRMKVKKVVSTLSTCIFPDNIDYPLTEKKIHNGPPHFSNEGYAYSKRMLEVQSRLYKQQYGCNNVCVIPTNIFGPFDNFNITNGHVIPSLIHKCYLAKKNKTDFIIWGSGSPLREFIFSKDIAKLITWVLEEYDDVEPLILSNSEEISIRDIVELIVDIFDFRGKVIYDTTKPEGQFRKPTDNSKLVKLNPNFKFTPIKEALEETINWFILNYEITRK